MNLLAIGLQILHTEFAFAFNLFRVSRRAFAGHAIKPSHRGVVVVRSRIGDNIAAVVVGQIDILRVAAERKLQNAHAGKTKVIPQSLNVRCNHTQVFGDDWQFAESVANRGEQFSTGSFDPAATLRSRVASRNFPTRGKSAEVIDPRNINHSQSGPHAFNPPRETIGEHALPIEDRISPVLARLAEIIRRHAGDHDRRAIGIELELIGIGPDIRRIMRHKDRNVADHFDAAPVAVGLQIEPLFEEEKLIELLRFDLVMKFLTSAPQGRGCTPSQRLFPLVPCGATMRGFQRAE